MIIIKNSLIFEACFLRNRSKPLSATKKFIKLSIVTQFLFRKLSPKATVLLEIVLKSVKHKTFSIFTKITSSQLFSHYVENLIVLIPRHIHTHTACWSLHSLIHLYTQVSFLSSIFLSRTYFLICLVMIFQFTSWIKETKQRVRENKEDTLIGKFCRKAP